MIRSRRIRLATIAVMCLIYTLLLIQDARAAFAVASFQTGSLRLGFSALIGLLYLSVGVLVWLHAANRRIALVFFAFACCAAYTFVVETGAKADDYLLSEVGAVSSALALAFLAALLLLFPHNALAPPRGGGAGPLPRRARALRTYLALLCAWAGVVVCGTFPYFFAGLPNPPWLDTLVAGYFLIGLVGCVVSLVFTCKGATTTRQKQQGRLLVSGVIVAVAPFCLLTLLPSLLGVPAALVVDSQISTASFFLLPLLFGYAMLRYQLLLFDAYIRRWVAGLVGVLGLLLLAYLLVSASSLLLPRDVSARVGFVVAVLVPLGSGLWWLAQKAVPRFLFSEHLFYRRLLERPDRLARETFDLADAATLIASAAGEAFGSPPACLFVLDEEAACYRPYFPGAEGKRAAQELMACLFACWRPVEILGKRTDWLDAAAPGLTRLAESSRPLRLREFCRDGGDAGRSRFLGSTRGGDADPLLAPLRVRGRVVGLLVLGPRGDGQAYAGADFEALALIFARFASALETARLHALDSSHAALVMRIYKGMPRKTLDQFREIEEVALRYAKVAASATSSCAEIWLAGEEAGEGQFLRRRARIGIGPGLGAEVERIGVAELPGEGLAPAFATWHSPPAWLPTLVGDGAAARFSLAWLPLMRGEQLLGALALTYPRPHAFSQKERRLLALFARQCASVLAHALLAFAHAATYERQLALDRQRDGFLLAAAADLRTPLATVEGYLELLREYAPHLTPEARRDYLSRVRRSCGELALLVASIIETAGLADAARPVVLRSLPLQEAISDMLGLREEMLRWQGRSVGLDVPDQPIDVLSEPFRLRQVVFQVLNTALALSPAGSALRIEVRARRGEGVVRVGYVGKALSTEEQQRLLAPFGWHGMGEGEEEPGWLVGGSSFGLYASRLWLEAMGGRVWVEGGDADGGGKALALALPLAVARQAGGLTVEVRGERETPGE